MINEMSIYVKLTFGVGEREWADYEFDEIE